MPARVRSREDAQRPAVQTRLGGLQDRARHPAGAGQGQEPLAERRRPQWGVAAGGWIRGGSDEGGWLGGWGGVMFWRVGESDVSLKMD